MMNLSRYTLVFLFLLGWSASVFANDTMTEQTTYSLNACITQALKIHPKLSIYTYKVDQKKERSRSVTAANLPHVDAVASYERLSYVPQVKQRYLGGSNNDYQVDIIVSQPLFTGGKITSQKRSARYGLNAAQQAYHGAKEDVIFAVKTAYYQLIFARDIATSKEDLFKYAESSYKTAVDLNKRTKVPREETLLRLAVQVNEVRQELITAEEGIKIAQKTLLNAMGLDSSGSIEVEDIKEAPFLSEDTPVALANNYEILKLAQDVKEADEQIKIAKSGFYPQLNARSSYGYEWGDWSQQGDTDWTAGLAVDLNIWDWGKIHADVKQAKAYKKELQSYENLLNQQLGLELASARLRYESASKRYAIARKSFDQAKRSLDLFESRYRDALVTSLELLDAQKAFSQAQVNLALSMLDMRLARSEIEKIAGNGYDLK